MEVCVEVCDPVDVRERLVFLAVDHVGEVAAFVEHDLFDRNGLSYCCVPGSALIVVEAGTGGRSVGESCIDDLRMGNSKDEFVNADSGQAMQLGLNSFVGGAFEEDCILKHRLVVGD